MHLADILAPDCIVLDADVADAPSALRALATVLARHSGGSERAIEDALAARERLGSTAIGHGFALPHARLPGVATPYAAYLRTRSPIEFAAPDQRPVRHLLALVVPANATEHHLRLLAEAAEVLGDRTLRESVRRAETPADVVRLFEKPPPR